jgi:basic membrane protein A and related proteins
MKHIYKIAVLVIALSLVVSCSDAPTSPTPTPTVLKVALALARGGLGDKAFNDSAQEGLQRAKTELGAQVLTVEFKEGDEQVENLRQVAGQDFSLIIALGAENAAPLKTVAAEYPNQRFAIIDTTVDAPNVTSMTFRELEGDFLAGALSALLSKSGKVGFLGGADVLVIRRIEFGWKQGVQHVNPQAEILSEYIGGKDDFSGFSKPEVGQSLTEQMYQQGAELVYAAAGKSALGAITAAETQKKLVITTGSDQRWISPEVVVTSRTKNMHYVVFTLVQQLQSGALKPGVQELDYKSGGIGLAPLEGTLVPADVLEKFREIQSDVESGKITVAPYVGT